MIISYAVLPLLLLLVIFSITNNNLTLAQNALLQTSNQTSSFLQITKNIPSAESVFSLQSMSLPTSVGSFVWYIVNEAHEDTISESHKLISNPT